MSERKWEAQGHRAGCSHYSDEAPTADPNSTHMDLFCDECHDHQEPTIGPNGTDVSWPAHWTEAEARYWRHLHGILRPGDTAPAACPRCNDEHWLCIDHGKPMGHGACRDEAGPCPVSNPLADDPGLTPAADLDRSLPKGFEIGIEVAATSPNENSPEGRRRPPGSR